MDTVELYIVMHSEEMAEYSGELHVDVEAAFEECGEANSAPDSDDGYCVYVREFESLREWLPADAGGENI